MDAEDIKLTTDRAEQLDAIFDQVEKHQKRCPIHKDHILYRDGCTACWLAAEQVREARRAKRRRR